MSRQTTMFGEPAVIAPAQPSARSARDDLAPILVQGSSPPPIKIQKTVAPDGQIGVCLERGGMRLALSVGTAIAVAAAITATAESIRRREPLAPEADR